MTDQEILDGLDWEVEWPDVVDVTTLTDKELMGLFAIKKAELLKLGEVIYAKTQDGRDAHSVYGACKIELARRKLL